MSDIIFNKNIAPYRKENDKSKDIVASSAVNFYEGVTRKEVEEFYKKKQSPDKERPLSFGLNSKVVKENNQVVEKVYRRLHQELVFKL